jgi:hypothetical protein
MHPYDKIISRDSQLFPVDDFSAYPRLIVVDWREEEHRILKSFFKATGLAPEGATLEMDDKTQYFQLVRGDFRIDIPWGAEASAQHSMLLALQQAFASTHSIRYLNHAAFGDAGGFVVETNETWRVLENQYPHVRWFFTPLALLPDTFKSNEKELHRVGAIYGAA